MRVLRPAAVRIPPQLVVAVLHPSSRRCTRRWSFPLPSSRRAAVGVRWHFARASPAVAFTPHTTSPSLATPLSLTPSVALTRIQGVKEWKRQVESDVSFKDT
ncbi:hypothetical protein AAHA92_01267 [Salvia divinorum]|uniref:Uncharacterized protein n=1 Tax=Salvia divinorum TaxID=28513 RepID=A0ABD1IMA1_SALDI